MATNLVLPELGENIETGVVVKILVEVGDSVDVDQPIIEIETDKAVVEVPSDEKGVVTKIFVDPGDEIKIGQKIVTIESESESDESDEDTEKAPESDSKSDRSDDEVQDVSSDQADESGKPETDPDTTPKEKAAEPEDDGKEEQKSKPVAETEAVAPAAPSVRRFAREIGVDVNAVPGTGPGNRISLEDVKKYAASNRTEGKESSGGLKLSESSPLPDFSKWGEIEKEPMSTIRKKTAAHVSHAWSTIPQVTHFDQADIMDLEKFRKKYGPKVTEAGGKLTVTAILMKIVAGALKVFPQFNAAVDVAREEIIYKKYYHIGIAVDTERGLLVPVVKDVERLNLIDISVALAQTAEKARKGKLSPDEMQGGNFTISNLGGIGGTGFTPIINAPEVAILGVSRSSWQPHYSDGHLSDEPPKPRLMLPLSLTYDHRVIDGAQAARFLRWIADAIEQPLLLTLEG